MKNDKLDVMVNRVAIGEATFEELRRVIAEIPEPQGAAAQGPVAGKSQFDMWASQAGAQAVANWKMQLAVMAGKDSFDHINAQNQREKLMDILLQQVAALRVMMLEGLALSGFLGDDRQAPAPGPGSPVLNGAAADAGDVED